MRKLAIIVSVAVMTIGMVACQHKQEATAAEKVRVKTYKVASSDIEGSRVYSGTVEESGASSVSFPVAGTMQSLYVGEGDRVAKGQLIAVLDGSTLRNTYDIAKAELDQAQDAYNRLKMLHDANSLPEIQWVDIQNKLRQAQSAEAIARRSMGDTRLTSPISGYVSEKYMDAGMNVAPGMPILKIVTINPVKVSVSVPENEISGIAASQTASVKVGALGGKTFSGRLTEKAVTANPLTRTYDVKLTVANPDAELLPGMICDVVLENSTPRHAMVLPLSAVLLDSDNQNFVWIDAGGFASKRVVTVDGMTDDGLIVSAGLKDGDMVIVEGQQKVSERTPIVSINK